MPLPQFPKKYNNQVVITPEQHFQAEKAHYQEFQVPKSVILCFESSIMDHFRGLDKTENRTFWTGEMIYLGDHDYTVAIVGNFGIGGPAATHMLEILIAAGVKEFIVVGHAGGLQLHVPVGTMVLVTKAVRDEGVSHHYMEPGKYAFSSSTLTNRLKAVLDQQQADYRIGGTWTISTMYRETPEEVEHYSKEGIDVVEMELAALFAVAEFRGVAIASLLTISDIVATDSWEEQLHSEVTSDALFKTIELVHSTLKRR